MDSTGKLTVGAAIGKKSSQDSSVQNIIINNTPPSSELSAQNTEPEVDIYAGIEEEPDESLSLEEQENSSVIDNNDEVLEEGILPTSNIEIPEPESAYDREELIKFVKQAAGPFYATYISHFHPTQLQKSSSIRKDAASEIIQFGKVLLTALKKER